jgi:hypothetical protein
VEVPAEVLIIIVVQVIILLEAVVELVDIVRV